MSWRRTRKLARDIVNMLGSLRRLGVAHLSASTSGASGLRAFATAQPSLYDVPAGHTESDLSSAACNTGLGRRRDLTLRSDVFLHSDGGKHSLAGLLKVSKQQEQCQDPIEIPLTLTVCQSFSQFLVLYVSFICSAFTYYCETFKVII